MDMALDSVVPESLNWLHTDEGPEYAIGLFISRLQLTYCVSVTVIREIISESICDKSDDQHNV
jgi:hypothetical protein